MPLSGVAPWAFFFFPPSSNESDYRAGRSKRGACRRRGRRLPQKHGMVVAVSPPGADTGRDILQKGGNAVDAAVATAFAMAVTYPSAGNIGGGGFMLVYPAAARASRSSSITARRPRRRPRKTMFTKTRQLVQPQGRRRPRHGARPGPGPPRFGKLPWKDRGAAGRQAGRGWLPPRCDAGRLAQLASSAVRRISRIAARLRQERREADWQAGDRLVQKDLAKTLRLIAEHGPGWLLQGPSRRAARRRDEARRRTDHAGRTWPATEAKAPQADPRHLPRLRRLRPAAAQLRRHLPGRDAQHPRKLRSAQAGPLVARRRCT